MTFKIQKTDKRHTGHEQFQWYIKAYGDWRTHNQIHHQIDKLSSLFELREWAWTTWGPSCERDYWLHILRYNIEHTLNTHWCWHTDNGECRLYLRTDKEANWFKLKWL